MDTVNRMIQRGPSESGVWRSLSCRRETPSLWGVDLLEEPIIVTQCGSPTGNPDHAYPGSYSDE